MAGLVLALFLAALHAPPAAAAIAESPSYDIYGYVYDLEASIPQMDTDASGASTVRTVGRRGDAKPSVVSARHLHDTDSFLVAPNAALDDVGQLALPRGGANLTQERLDHIVLLHWPTSGATNARKFGSGTSLNDVTTMVDDTVRNGAFRPNWNGRPGTIFEMDLGLTIGTNIRGNATSRLRVVVSPSGDAITAFPS